MRLGKELKIEVFAVVELLENLRCKSTRCAHFSLFGGHVSKR